MNLISQLSILKYKTKNGPNNTHSVIIYKICNKGGGKMKNLEEYPEVLNVNDVQQILGIGRRQAYELVGSGQFHSVRIGKRIKIFKHVLVSWLDGANKAH
jgi:predicted DNA-binding transcriptional regulator AlpA